MGLQRTDTKQVVSAMDDENELDDEEEEDDEFFGSQEQDGAMGANGVGGDDFGDMGRHELHARNHRLQTAGFLDAFETSKEERLQEGFEAGFLESFDVGQRLGKLLGRAATLSKLLGDENGDENEGASNQANEKVHAYFANEFQRQRDPAGVRDDLHRLVEETQACLGEEAS